MLSKEELGEIISQFYCGENDGAKLVHELIAFAPEQHESEFCRYWEKDEQKHDRLFGTIIHQYPIKQKEFKELMGGIFAIAWDCVREKEWTKCMAIAAVIENIALTAGLYLEENGDAPVKNILREVLPDEQKHLAFSEQQLRNLATQEKEQEKNKEKIKEVIKRVKQITFSLGKKRTLSSHEIIILNRTQNNLLNQLEAIGISYPNIRNKNGFLRNWAYEKLANF